MFLIFKNLVFKQKKNLNKPEGIIDSLRIICISILGFCQLISMQLMQPQSG